MCHAHIHVYRFSHLIDGISNLGVIKQPHILYKGEPEGCGVRK